MLHQGAKLQSIIYAFFDKVISLLKICAILASAIIFQSFVTCSSYATEEVSPRAKASSDDRSHNHPSLLISDIFIESNGNNEYEAKIKAHQQGMQRALILLADKMSIDTSSISSSPYSRLKDVFKPISVTNESSEKEKYSAMVSYEYSQGQLYRLLLDYGDHKIDEMFHEYILIPAFKQGSYMNIWDKDKRWNDLWTNSKKLLNTHKLYFPEKSLYTSKRITPENILTLTYNDFIDIFQNQLFKGVLIITAEFFTDRITRESIIRVTTHVVHSDGSPNDVFEKDYPLNTIDDIGYTVDLVIDNIVDDFGALKHIDPKDEEDEDQLTAEESKPEIKTIVMNFDVYDPDDLQIVEDKLSKVKQIDSFKIEHDYNNRHKIIMHITGTEFELAEGMYINGLTFRIHGNLYNLIDIKKGI